MQLKEFNYFKPETLKELRSLIQKKRDSKLLAGGTFLLTALKESETYPKNIISINRVKELSGVIKKVNSICIGATATLDDIARDKIIKLKLPLLTEAIEYIATPQIRNMATIGGNVCSGLPWADLPHILLALGAEFNFDKNKIKAEEFVGKPSHFFRNSILKSIDIPVDTKIKYAYIRMPRANEEDIPLVSVCLLVKDKKAIVTVNFGNRFPVRLKRSEDFLNKNDISKNVLGEAIKILEKEIALLEKDDYRKQMIKVCFKRAIERYESLYY